MVRKADHVNVYYSDGAQVRLEGNFFLAWKVPGATLTLCEIDMTVEDVVNFFLEAFRSLGRYLDTALDAIGLESKSKVSFGKR